MMPNSPPKTTQYLVSEPGGIELKAEVEHVEGMENDAKIATEFAQGASAAERTEHDLTFWQSLVNYKGAVFWSLAISMCIVSGISVGGSTVRHTHLTGHGGVRPRPHL